MRKKKMEKKTTLLLHSAQLAELRTCRLTKNVTSSISKRQLLQTWKILPSVSLSLTCQ